MTDGLCHEQRCDRWTKAKSSARLMPYWRADSRETTSWFGVHRLKNRVERRWAHASAFIKPWSSEVFVPSSSSNTFRHFRMHEWIRTQQQRITTARPIETRIERKSSVGSMEARTGKRQSMPRTTNRLCLGRMLFDQPTDSIVVRRREEERV